MAKAKPNEKPSGTPLERTARLAQKLIGVPKAEVDKVKRRQAKRHS